METTVAHVRTHIHGVPCEPSSASDIAISEDGCIRLVPKQSNATLVVSVPSVFDVRINMRGGACEVDISGWLEGSVDVATESGGICVGTVKGMLTKLRTMCGALKVGSIDGNLDAETSKGRVDLGKVIGEEVRAVTADGDIQVKAVYAKRAELRACEGKVSAAVLSLERGTLFTGGHSQLSSLDGNIDIVVAKGSLVVQAAERLRRLRVVATELLGAGPASS